MTLDKRIKSLSDVLTCFDNEKAKSFIGQKGYFTNDLYRFSDVLSCYHDTLTNVKDNDDDDNYLFKDDDNHSWDFFIPESRLHIEKKELRPYTLEEFKRKFLVGQSIMFRKKGEKGCEVYSLLGGYRHEQIKEQTITSIYIGYRTYTLDELFENYEWQASDSEDFKPFGVEK